MIQTESSKEWQKRRSEINHNWLASSFDRDLYNWKSIFQTGVEYDNFTKEQFIPEVIEVWNKKQKDIQNLINDYESTMTPASLFANTPLSYVSDQTREWLEPLIHELWRIRYNVDQQKDSVRNALNNSNEILLKIKKIYYEIGFEALIGNIEFIDLLKDYIDSARALSKAISDLNRDIKVV